jgi:predicted secreted protein
MLARAAALALAALALVAGCGGDDNGGDQGIVFEDPRGSVDVETGARFTFEFSVNAGVGVDWEAVGVPAGVALVELKDTEVEYPDEQRAGDSGKKRFVYDAKGPGRQVLVFRKLYRGDLDERRPIAVNIR